VCITLSILISEILVTYATQFHCRIASNFKISHNILVCFVYIFPVYAVQIPPHPQHKITSILHLLSPFINTSTHACFYCTSYIQCCQPWPPLRQSVRYVIVQTKHIPIHFLSNRKLHIEKLTKLFSSRNCR
jgi:hypothetical protein